MSGIEDMGEVTSQLGIGVENLVWVNGEMLGVYLGDKPNPEELTAPQQVLVEVIIHQEEHVKFQKIVNESGVKVTFSSLFWSDSNEATPAQIVIEALTDYRLGLNTQGSKESEKWGELAKYYSKVYPENALGRIYLLYMRLMDKIDKREPFLRKDAKELVQLLVKLNEKGISIILNQLLAFAVEN